MVVEENLCRSRDNAESEVMPSEACKPLSWQRVHGSGQERVVRGSDRVSGLEMDLHRPLEPPAVHTHVALTALAPDAVHARVQEHGFMAARHQHLRAATNWGSERGDGSIGEVRDLSLIHI